MKRPVENRISSSADSLSHLTLGLHTKWNLLAVAATCWNVNKCTSASICPAGLPPQMLSFNTHFYPKPCIPNTGMWKTQAWRAQWRSGSAKVTGAVKVTGDPSRCQQTVQINCFTVPPFFFLLSPSSLPRQPLDFLFPVFSPACMQHYILKVSPINTEIMLWDRLPGMAALLSQTFHPVPASSLHQ